MHTLINMLEILAAVVAGLVGWKLYKVTVVKLADKAFGKVGGLVAAAVLAGVLLFVMARSG